MIYRKFGRTGWQVSEVGYGMWGLAGWTGSDDAESLQALERAIELGCNFFDTAWAYGAGHSESLLGSVVRKHPDKTLYVATKIPPKNFTWPSQRGFTLDDCFPPEHIRDYAERSLDNLGLQKIDLLQFHVWEDSWAEDVRWQQEMSKLKDEGLVGAVGVSVNRWEPKECVRTLRSGLIDSVQVIYNIFDQAPEDELFPLCRELDIAVIARVPFDEGTLTGNLTPESTWPEEDWRNGYFNADNLKESLERADNVRLIVPDGMTMAELALRWILQEPTVSTVIPGMRKVRNVEANIAASDGKVLDVCIMNDIRTQRWDRSPTSWSQ
jgi:aryl-alcohol dehydrogenase-like predicted oxidoreductase